MGSECGSEKTPPPKLSLYSLPTKAEEPSGMKTPPIHTSVSIPFRWEEAPGKPRLCGADSQSKPHSVRCLELELPPRLLTEAKVSPATLSDGPDAAGRFVSQTLSFRKGSPEDSRVSKEKTVFGSSRWGSFRKRGRVVQGSFDFSSTLLVDDGGTGGGAQVTTTRFRRKVSLSSVSAARSHVLASIYKSIKQVVPWRHVQEKTKKKGS